jgi:signal transduction histidine kinase
MCRIFFDRFQRVGNVVGKIGGSGIGLASVRQIIDAHGGTIGVESEENVGSTFTVRVPLHSPRKPAAGGPASNEGRYDGEAGA